MFQQNIPQFQPSLLIFVGEAGERIREYLSPYYYDIYQRWLPDPPAAPYHLLTHLDSPLRDCVALLQIVTEGPRADAGTAIAYPVMETFPDDADIPKGNGPLQDMIFRSLHSIMLSRRTEHIHNTYGYDVPETSAQVFIIGEPNSNNKPWMAHILSLVLKYKYVKRAAKLVVCYVLNRYGADDDKDSPGSLKKPFSATGLTWDAYDTPDFTYLYECSSLYPTFQTFTPDEVRYATAEALLTLVSTGITASQPFKDVMPYVPLLENYEDRVGSLSTSMLRFPHSEAHRFCATHYTSKLVQQWRDDFNNSMPAQHANEAQAASNLADAAFEWLDDSDERPNAEESYWPSFELLQSLSYPGIGPPNNMQQESHTRLRDRTERLFAVFSYEDIADAFKNDHTQPWDRFISGHLNQARALYAQWHGAAASTWNALNARISDYIRHQVDDRWRHHANGFMAARAFIISLDDEMAQVNNQILKLGEKHTTWYENHYQAFERDSRGEWITTEDEQSIRLANPGTQGSIGQARPTMGNIDLRLSAGTAQGNNLALLPMPAPEASVARNLLARATWKQQQVPSVAALGAWSAVGWFVLNFATLAFGLATLAPFVALLSLLPALALYLQRQQETQEARKRVVQFYQVYYIHLCEQFEDARRIAFMRTERERIGRIRQRLENLLAFFDTVQGLAEIDRQRASDRLFKGPASTRDVFVAKGERLFEQGAHTLEDVAEQIDQARQSNQERLAPWHRTFDTMKEELVRRLNEEGRSLLEMDEQQVQDYLYSFMGEVIKGYLSGPLVDISAALDKRDIWHHILEQRRRPVYTTDTGNRDPRLTVAAASPQALNKSQPSLPVGTFRQATKSTQWALLGSLFRGGNSRGVDADALFPTKLPQP